MDSIACIRANSNGFILATIVPAPRQVVCSTSHIQWTMFLPEDSVKVMVENGWITLSGNVAWEYQRHELQRANGLAQPQRRTRCSGRRPE